MSERVSFSKEQPNLDLIRATAVLSVALAHLYERVTNQTSEVAWHFGQMGVLIFFVHTACVLMWSLERSAQHLSGRALWCDFYIRRAFRIYPLAILCIVLSYFGFSLIQRDWTPFDLAANLTLTMNLFRAPIMWGGHWTLPIEVQMYLVLPLLYVCLRSRGVGLVLAVWAAAVVAGYLQPTNRLNALEYSPCFVAGVLAWHLARRRPPSWRGEWWPVVFVATWSIWLVATREDREYYRWAFCLALGFAIPLFQNIPWAFLARPAAQVAKYSYGIYLSHTTVFAFALTFDTPWLRWPLMAVLAAIVPALLFHFVEEPMIRAGRRVAEWASTRGGAESVVAAIPPIPLPTQGAASSS